MALEKRRRKKKRSLILPWLLASRPATLIVSLSAVSLGWGAALLTVTGRKASLLLVALAALTAVLLQIGANYINDYGDGIRGADSNRSHASRRLTASGANPFSVLTTGLSFLIAAAGSGLIAVILTRRWQLILVGVFSIAAAYLYTAGPFPYAYFGLGELSVFIFFGPVTVIGTVFLLSGIVTLSSFLVAVVAGSWSAAILLMNNLRDHESDMQSNKRTFSVLFGVLIARIVCIALIAVPYIVVAILLIELPFIGYVFLTLLLSAPIVIILATAVTSKEFAIAFRLGIICLIPFAIFFTWGLAS
uniref:1,4-dihydroxy-2-naphthoate octaprenyltransferase n=1 Tax=Tropheryma whipplei TaxID=2039 RepID=UPI0005AAE086|nr:1,4-dihydroxy-2-naphthoate octaprenyltransferase [Tropheryma whipplei]